MDTIQILKENTPKRKGVFHCCPLNIELVKEGLKLGFYISLAGPITFKNSKNADEIIQIIPEDKLFDLRLNKREFYTIRKNAYRNR